MATVGEQLTAPEAGWKRYDDTHPAIKYTNLPMDKLSSIFYNSTIHYIFTSSNVKVEFDFIGTKLRLISSLSPNYSQTPNTITIDGVDYNFKQYDATKNGQKYLVYEITGLENKRHSIKIVPPDGVPFGIDAIDIDSTGRLLHSNEVLTPKELEIGKRIRCHYQATASNTVGTFSNLGEETYKDGINDFLPATPTATPNGDFYFIMVDDWNGKKRLIADRNIQNSISWDTLNNNGLVFGNKLNFGENYDSFEITTRLLTGGISSADKDNEWDQYIVNSDLNGAITPGDNNVWNAGNSRGSWTSTTPANSSTYRVRRGSDSILEFYTMPSSSVRYYEGFRPVLEVEGLISFKHLLYHNGEYGYVGEKDGIIPKLNANINGEEEAFADDVFYNSNINFLYEPYLAFSQKHDTLSDCWATQKTYGFIGYKFSGKEIVAKYSFGGQISYPNSTPKNWTFEGSNDGDTWDILDSRTNEINWNDKEIRTYIVSNPGLYQYYRLNVSQNNGHSYLCISMFQMYDPEWNKISEAVPTQEQFEEYGTDNLTEWADYINKLDGDKKIVTSTDGELKGLNIKYIPEPQLIKQQDSINVSKDTFDTLTLNATESNDNIRVAVVFPDVDSQVYVYKNNTWSTISITDAESFIQSANTVNEINTADWSTSPLNEKLQFIYSLKMKDILDAISLNNIDIQLKGLVSSSPTINEITDTIKAYTLNGYLEELERNNTINFSKLEFKTDALMNAKKNKMHNIVIDTFNEDSIITLSSSKPDVEITLNASEETVLSNGYIKTLSISDDVKIIELP